MGSGWGQFTNITAASKGVIFAVRPDGTLVEYVHLDYLTGSSQLMQEIGGKKVLVDPVPRAHWQGPLSVAPNWQQYQSIAGAVPAPSIVANPH